MTSRLHARLDVAIARSRQPVEVACLRAERASVLAREGRIDEARRAIDELQARFALRPQAAVSAWLALAEGLCDHYGSVASTARDRLQRAHALSRAASLASLHALAAAWLAHMDFVQHEMTQMADHLGEALRSTAADPHGAQLRACMVAAFAYHFADRMDRARPWYERARQHALNDGDEAALGALIYNRASMQGNSVRLAAAFDADVAELADQAREALMGADASAAYERGAGCVSLEYLAPTLRAQVLAAEGRHAEALALYTQWFERAVTDGPPRMRPALLADIAWCELNVGHADAARVRLAVALDSLNGPCETDDRAVACALLAKVCAGLGDSAAAALWHERARRDLAVHRAEQQRLVGLLDDALAGL